jgi:hypothetical protein
MESSEVDPESLERKQKFLGALEAVRGMMCDFG